MRRCGGAGIAEGACDCDGNVADAIGVCGGACTADANADGICDDVDDCISEYICLNDDNIHEAVALWLTNQDSALTTYGLFQLGCFRGHKHGCAL